MSDESLKRVPLHDRIVAAGGRMVPFAGYSMPVQFTSIMEEHKAVREAAGLFDVSHMGQVYAVGPDAVAAVDRLVTNDVSGLVDGKALYTVMCNADGGIVDDLVIYRLSAEELLLCVNAANREADLAHMGAHLSGDVELQDRSDDMIQLAIQGPRAEELLQALTEADLKGLKFFRCQEAHIAGQPGLVARTGYTGEDGFELYLSNDGGAVVFDALTERFPEELTLCGLGCRDTLRLEAGLMLHGQDIGPSTNPYEAGLGWVVKLNKDSDFVGRGALAAIKEAGPARRLRGFVVEGRGVPRPGYPIQIDGEEVGSLTSGGYSPTLEEGIALGYIDSAHADVDSVEIAIRKRSVVARVVKPPFYRRPKT